MLLSRKKVFPFPTNSLNCYEDTRLRSADLKINHETRVLLLMANAYATPPSDSSLCLILTCCCETVPTVPVVSAHHQYQDKTYTHHLVNAFPVQQETSLCAKQEDPVNVMLSIIKSVTMAWDLFHGSQARF